MFAPNILALGDATKPCIIALPVTGRMSPYLCQNTRKTHVKSTKAQCRVLDLRSGRHCVVSLSKTLYPLLSNDTENIAGMTGILLTGIKESGLMITYL